MSIVWLISDFCPRKCGFPIFFMIFNCYNHRNPTKSYSKMQIMDKFILHPKSITLLVCVKFMWLKDVVLLYDQTTNF